MDTLKQLQPVDFQQIKDELYSVFSEEPQSADFVINAAVNGMSKLKAQQSKVLKPDWIDSGLAVLEILKKHGMVTETEAGYEPKPALLSFMKWHRPFAERGADKALNPIANRDYVSRGKSFSRA